MATETNRKKKQKPTELEFKQRLLELGLLKAVTPPLEGDRVPRGREPAELQGKPISEELIEARR